MIFYMAVRYEGGNGEPDLEVVDYVNSSPNGQPYMGKLSTLIAWNNQDPPDDFERNRNDVIYYDWQHNRNPFIDHPEYVNAIWAGGDANEQVIDIANTNLSIYPNPFNPKTNIAFYSVNSEQNATVTIYNIRGEKVIDIYSGNLDKGKNYNFVWDGKNSANKAVSSGNYIVLIKGENYRISKSVTLLK